MTTLARHEKGRGVRLSPERTRELEDICLTLLKNGATQADITAALGASKSRTSRWIKAAIERSGDHKNRRLIKTSDLTLSQMLWSRIDIQNRNDCWNWIGTIKGNGYGTLTYKDQMHHAHRAIFELLVTSIPKGKVVDHICGNKRCVNPLHLQCISQSENVIFAHLREAQ